jgi:hypothetical protein
MRDTPESARTYRPPVVEKTTPEPYRALGVRVREYSDVPSGPVNVRVFPATDAVVVPLVAEPPSATNALAGGGGGVVVVVVVVVGAGSTDVVDVGVAGTGVEAAGVGDEVDPVGLVATKVVSAIDVVVVVDTLGAVLVSTPAADWLPAGAGADRAEALVVVVVVPLVTQVLINPKPIRLVVRTVRESDCVDTKLPAVD